MKRDIVVVGAGIVAAVAAFAVGPPPAPIAAPAQLQSLTGILERIRQDAGFYEVQAARWRGDIPESPMLDPALTVPAHDDPPDADHPQGQHSPSRSIANACPIDQYDFDIVKIELTLQVVSADTMSGHMGLKVPYLGADLSGGAGASRAKTVTKTVVLDRTMPYDLVKLTDYFKGDDYKRLARGSEEDHAAPAGGPTATAVFPISDALLALRQNLVLAAEKEPCFDVDPAVTSNDSLKLDFQVQTSMDKDVGFTFLLYSASADDKNQKNSENTMVVTFAPHSKPHPS